jgi:hypothetical protein
MIELTHNRILKYSIKTELELASFLNEQGMSQNLNIENITFLAECLKTLGPQLMSVFKFRSKFLSLLSGTSKFQVKFWESRGFSLFESERLSKEFAGQAATNLHNSRTSEERKRIATKAGNKRSEQIEELKKTNPLKLKEQTSTTVEYYLAKGMNQQEAEQAQKDRQSTFSKKKMIAKHGEEEGLKKWEERQKKWISSLRENNDWDELSKRKGASLEKMVEKYGFEEGTEKWETSCKMKGGTKENFVRLYGECEGVVRYAICNTKKGYGNTIECYLEKFGEEEGLIKWKERLEKNVSFGSASKESLLIFLPLLEEFKDQFRCYLGHDDSNEWFIWDNDLRKQFRYDFTLREPKLIIEYYGEAFHPNKNRLTGSEWNEWKSPFSKGTADEAFEGDQHKKKLAEENGFKVLELWSSTPVSENIELARKFILENS